MRTPRVFISATSRDLGNLRAMAKDALLAMDCHPILQDTFEPDYRKVGEMLRARIRECDAVIHVVGKCYGEEPSPKTDPRRSYTQMEADIARNLGKKLYVFLCGEDFPYQSCPPEPLEKQELQAAYRKTIADAQTLYTPVATVEAFGMDLRELRIHSQLLRSALRSVALLATAVVLLAVLLLVGGALLTRQPEGNREPTATRAQVPAAAAMSGHPGIPSPSLDPFAGPWGKINPKTAELELQALSGVIDRVRRVRLGETAEDLTRTVSAPERHGFAEVRGIPVSPAWKSLFVQLEHEDGALSETREIPIGDAFVDFVALPEIPGSHGSAPPVFVNLKERHANVSPPEGTERVLFHLGNGRWEPFIPDLSRLFSLSRGPSRSKETPPALHLQFVKADGTSVGPFSYQMEPLFADEMTKAEIEMRTQGRELVRAVRVPFTLPMEVAAGENSYSRKAVIERALRTAGLLTLKKAPITVVKLDTNRNVGRLWASVKQVHVGASPETMRVTAECLLLPSDVVLNPSGFYYENFFSDGPRILVPADWKRVFVQFAFRSGKTSESFEVVVEDLRLPE